MSLHWQYFRGFLVPAVQRQGKMLNYATVTSIRNRSLTSFQSYIFNANDNVVKHTTKKQLLTFVS